MNLNPLADKNDLIRITTSINGGLNGYDSRKRNLLICFNALMVYACDKINFDITHHAFSSSAAFNHTRSALAWGVWHDPTAFPSCTRMVNHHPTQIHIASKSGTTKDLAASKEGYKKYNELKLAHPLDHAKTAFGLLPSEWEPIVRTRC